MGNYFKAKELESTEEASPHQEEQFVNKAEWYQQGEVGW